MATLRKSQSLQSILGQLRNDLEVVERKWDNYSEGRAPNSGRDSFLHGIQGYYRLRPTEGRQTFCIGDIAMVHDTLHLHRRYNSRASVEKVLDVVVDLRLLRWNVERLLRTIGNSTNTASSREKLLSLQNDTATWKEVLADKFSLVEMTAPSSPLFLRTLGDVLWKCVNSAVMIANFLLEAIENGWPGTLQLMWRKLASRELHASAELDVAAVKPLTNADGKKSSSYRRSTMDARELDKLISQKQKLLKSMEAGQRHKKKSDYPWDEEEDDDVDYVTKDNSNSPDVMSAQTSTDKPEKPVKNKGVKVKFEDEASVISTEGNITVQIINQDRSSSGSSLYPVQPIQPYPALTGSSPPPQRATYIRSIKDDESKETKTKPYVDLVKDNDNNVVLIRRPQMEKQVLLPSLLPRLSSATLRPARVLLTEVPEKDKEDASISTKDLKNVIHKIEGE